MPDGAGELVFESLEGSGAVPPWFGAVFAIVRRCRVGGLEFELRDGRVFRSVGPEPGPVGRIVIENDRTFARMIRGGKMGFAESYLDGDWTSPDLQAVLDAALLNNERVARAFTGNALLRRVERARHWLRRNTRSGAEKNIRAHYDIGNEFYKLWLDETMTYSSALFDKDDLSLADAQRRKYASICDRMALKPDDHVLEIGCGWGGFAEYAAKERGARVTGLTISPSQLDFARRRIQRAGLSERVNLIHRDYRDERGSYDGVASIEMFEAVGEKYWPAYFEAVRNRLRPAGRASLQIITIDDTLFNTYRGGVDFIQKYIFPGGMLPSIAALRSQTDAAGLAWNGHMTFGDSYSRTLRAWLGRFDKAWGEVRALPADPAFDDRFRRMWRFYLAVCAACFRAKTTDVAQIVLSRA